MKTIDFSAQFTTRVVLVSSGSTKIGLAAEAEVTQPRASVRANDVSARVMRVCVLCVRVQRAHSHHRDPSEHLLLVFSVLMKFSKRRRKEPPGDSCRHHGGMELSGDDVDAIFLFFFFCKRD
jgi:hypothetical protein